MKKMYLTFLLLLSFGSGIAQQPSAILFGNSFWAGTSSSAPLESNSAQFAISHGHCTTLASAKVSSVIINYSEKDLRDLRINFDIDTKTIHADFDDLGEISQGLKSADGFAAVAHPKMSFKCTNSMRLGKDWYQLNGTMTIRGKSQPLALRATPIYQGTGCSPKLVKFLIDGEVNLLDFDYGKEGPAGEYPMGKTMWINLAVIPAGC